MKLIDRAKWERTRSRGFLHFVVVWGLCYFGGLMFVGSRVIDSLSGRDPFAHLTFTVLLYVATGLAWGTAVWAMNEYLFTRGARRSIPPAA